MKNMKAFSIAMAFAGTIIGAGFASGQELMQFFGNFGMMGILGSVVAVLFFAGYAYVVMKLAKEKETKAPQLMREAIKLYIETRNSIM